MRGHVRQRGKGWEAIWDEARQDGTRQQRSKMGFPSKRAAQAALRDTLRSIDRGEYVQPSDETVAAYLESWLPTAGLSRRATTSSSYADMLRSHVLGRIGGLPLQALSASALNSLYGELLKSGGRKGLSPTTVAYCHRILRRALGDAVRWGRLVRNPAALADPPKPNRPEMKTWTADQVRAFLASVREDRLYAAWHVLAMTGLRRGELLALRWADVDLEAGRVSVTRSMVLVGYVPTISEPKTAKGRRSVALDPGTVAVLREHRKRQIEERLAWAGAYQEAGLIFVREDGSPVHPDRLRDMFGHRVKAAGLPPIRLHDLRHSHASIALAAGVHAKIVSERLGHASIAITMDTYSHVLPSLGEEAAATVAALVLG